MSVHRNPRAYGGDFLLRNLWTASRGRKSNPEILTVLGSVCKENQSWASFPRFRFCISINDKKPRGHAPMKTAWGRLLICHCGKKFNRRVWNRQNGVSNPAIPLLQFNQSRYDTTAEKSRNIYGRFLRFTYDT